MPETVLITGASGYIGGLVARRILDTTQDRLVLLVRGAGSAVHARDPVLQRVFAHRGTAGRVELVDGDLGDPAPFAALDPARITRIVHSAAITRFNVEADAARSTNEIGAARVFELAGRCPALESLTHVSTVYASGLSEGLLGEGPWSPSAGFANEYERSKWAAEEQLLRSHGSLPFRVARIATVIADDPAGHVTQYNAFHNTLKLIFYGLVSLVPARADTKLYFVTGDFVASTILACERAPAHRFYNVLHSGRGVITVDELLDIAFEVFSRDADFRARGAIRPLYADAESFEMLAEGVGGFGSPIMRDALSSLTPFARQLFAPKTISNDNTRSLDAGYEDPDMRAIVTRTCERLVETRWGRNDSPPVTSPAAT